MNVVGGQMLEATAGAASKPRAPDRQQPAGDGGFAAALERCVDAAAPQSEPLGAPARDGRMEQAADRADEDPAPDAIAALLAGVVPQMALAATQPPAEGTGSALRRADQGASTDAAAVLVGRSALQAAALATPASPSTAGTGLSDRAAPGSALTSQPGPREADHPAAPAFLPPQPAVPTGPAAAARAPADRDRAADDASSLARMAVGNPAGGRESAGAASRGAAALGDGLAAATQAPTAGTASTMSQPLPRPTGPLAGPGRYQAPDDATGVTASVRAATATAPTPMAAAEHEHGPREQAADHADSAPTAATAATLPGGLAPGVSGTGPARAEVAAPVGSPEWPAALGQQLARLPQGQEVELHLHPVELGPLKVKLSMQDGQAQLTFVAASPLVRDAIEAALPQLKINLAEHGIGLGQTSVGSGSDQAHAQSGTWNGSAHDQRGERAPQPGAVRPREPAAAAEAAPRLSPRRGTIDAFV